MDKAAYLQANLIPVVTLVVLYFNSRAKLPFSRSNRLLRLLILLILGAMVCDVAATLLNGMPGPGMRRALWLGNNLSFLFSCAVALCWYLYVSSRVWQELFPLWQIPLLAPAFFSFLMVLGTPYHGYLFTLDEANVYQRGAWFFLQYVIAMFYLAAASMLALGHLRRAAAPEVRREYRNICLLYTSRCV